jgi:soluble lytic murein transglycosylase-like protein
MTRLATLLAFVVALAPGTVEATGRGDRGPDVVEIQTILHDFGYTVAVDGVYGKQTERAVKAWQRSNGLAVDGIVGPLTIASLRGATRVGNAHTVGESADPGPVPVRTVEQIIRDVWPDDLEDRALTIAWRESRYRPDVTSSTGCCRGVFQLHQVHLSWMRAYGVTSVNQLFDAETNIRMALVLFQRSGWGPWAATNY